jgi:hypothetical protein
VCKAPEQNTYCVGWKSFPGDVIARERELAIEKCHAGCLANTLEGYIPPCSYSYNAFGLESAPAASNPPDFFFGGAERREWTLPPATVGVWPYEAMYAEEVKASGYLDNDRRRALTLAFFQPIERDCGNNLIFYYANYSNPMSDDDTPRYAMIGVSRILQPALQRGSTIVTSNLPFDDELGYVPLSTTGAELLFDDQQLVTGQLALQA